MQLQMQSLDYQKIYKNGGKHMEQQTTQVLVVDDNPEIRDIIHVLLESG